MATPTFTFSPPPGPSSTIARAYRTLIVTFGDGYEQRSVDGINSATALASLAWDNLTNDEANTIIALFDGVGGVIPFFYLFPGEAAPILWVLDKNGVSRNPVNGQICNLKVSLRQVHDLVT